MSDNTDYNKEEWRDLILLASIGLGYKFVKTQKNLSISKMFSMIKEAFSYQQVLSQMKSKYSDNRLICDIVANINNSSMNNNRHEMLDKIKNFESLVDRVNEILAEKSNPEEAGEYRAFVYELSCEVCKAAGGGFLGLSSDIDAEEAQFLKDLKKALLGD